MSHVDELCGSRTLYSALFDFCVRAVCDNEGAVHSPSASLQLSMHLGCAWLVVGLRPPQVHLLVGVSHTVRARKVSTL